MNVPLVLDAIPRERGQSKEEIVDELLTQTTKMIDNLDLVLYEHLTGLQITALTHSPLDWCLC